MEKLTGKELMQLMVDNKGDADKVVEKMEEEVLSELLAYGEVSEEKRLLLLSITLGKSLREDLLEKWNGQ